MTTPWVENATRLTDAIADLADGFEPSPPDGDFLGWAGRLEIQERAIVAAIIGRLEASRAPLIIAHEVAGIHKLAPSTLRHVPPSRVLRGIFDGLDFHLQHLHHLQGGVLYVPRQIRFGKGNSHNGGRPASEMREAYLAEFVGRGCKRPPGTLKEIALRLAESHGIEPPTPKTIRDWESAARSRTK